MTMESGTREIGQEEYDFIVVGGGLSGCVVAGRTSEKFSVLVLEAGGDPGETLDIPVTVTSYWDDPKFVKIYPSVKQINAGLDNNGICSQVIGKVLGGGSSVNGMVYNRGSPLCYDTWAEVTGDPSWSYTNMLKYFKRCENYQGKFYSDEEHGKGGPIPISSSKYSPGLESWLQAGKHLGYQIADPNGPQKISFTPVEFSRRNGKRVSAYTGYIKPYLESRPQLKVLQHWEVSKILFEGNKAVGVEYTQTVGGTKSIMKAFAKKEVILSAGTLDSPAILMRSGIGPKDILERAKIPVKKVLPVGRNLLEHVAVELELTLDGNLIDESEVLILERDLTPENLRLFEETGDGPYSSLTGLHGQAFLQSSIRGKRDKQNWADIHLMCIHSPGELKIKREESPETKDGRVGIAVLVDLVRPQSVGSVTLDPSNVNGVPLVDWKFLSHPEDMEVLLEGVKLALKIFEETPPYQKLGAKYSTKPLETCKDLPFRSDDYWRRFISHKSGSAYHAGGTCRMGRGGDDPDAVVDSNLKVIGMEGLRVVDISIMPILPTGNTQAAAYAIGEKAAEIILMDWNN